MSHGCRKGFRSGRGGGGGGRGLEAALYIRNNGLELKQTQKIFSNYLQR